MDSQHLTTTPHLDGYLKGIKDEFDRLNHELDETRKQRDEYIKKYRNQANELRELRQTVSIQENHTAWQQDQVIAHACGVTDDNAFPLISPVSSSEYHSTFDGEDATSDNAKEIGDIEGERNQEGDQSEINLAPTITGTVSRSLHANVTPASGYSAWKIESNSNPTAALNWNLVHKLTQEKGTGVTFSMDWKYLAFTPSKGIVSVIDTKTGKRIMHNVSKNPYRVEKFLPSYSCFGFSPDNKYLATGEEGGNIRIWIISQGRVRNIFKHRRNVDALSFSPNGRLIVSSSFDMAVIIWGLRDGSSRILTADETYPWPVRFSLDGQYVASGDNVGNILIWNVRTGKLVVRWRAHFSLVSSLAFTPDGKRLLSGSWDRQVSQWDVSSLSSHGTGMFIPLILDITRIISHTSWISCVSISPDGKWIAYGSGDHEDKTMRIWNVNDGDLHCTLHCPGSVWTVNFSPVGNCLAIAGDFEGVTIWNYVDP